MPPQPAVIEAAHVRKQPFEWSTCGNQIRYTSTRKNLPRDTYPALVKRLRVVIYNGDWDACVPHTDGEAWTRGMEYDEAAPWHPWRYKNNTQVAGYAIVRRCRIKPESDLVTAGLLRLQRLRPPRLALRCGSATRLTTSPFSRSKAGGTRCRRRRPSRLLSSSGGLSAARASDGSWEGERPHGPARGKHTHPAPAQVEPLVQRS